MSSGMDWLQTDAAQALLTELQAIGPAPLMPVEFDWLQRAELQLSVWRGDLLDVQLSGNKFYKLKYNLLRARALGIEQLASFGGAYSNHLHALAAAGQRFGFKTHGFIRGEPHVVLNPSLQDATAWGMQLHYLSRADYRRRTEPDFIAQLQADLPQPLYWLPEGGSNRLALRGVAELARSFSGFDYVLTAVGSAATYAGLLSALPSGCQLLGIAVLKGAEYLQAEVEQLLAGQQVQASGQILLDWHQGGYGKITPALRQTLSDWSSQLPLEPFYTAKVCQALHGLAEAGYFRRSSRLLLLHTGGLQGWREQAL